MNRRELGQDFGELQEGDGVTAAPMRTALVSMLFAFALAASAPALAEGSAGRFQIPSRSMQPTLLPGTTVSAVRYPPGAAPASGDIVAFRLPRDPKVTFLYRVIGLPGDRVQMVDGLLHINGAAVKREPLEDFVDKEDGQTVRVKRWRETLPNGVAYETLDLVDRGPLDDTAVFAVPPGNVFVLGDNRDNAQDSRLETTGFIPLTNIVGRIEPPGKVPSVTWLGTRTMTWQDKVGAIFGLVFIAIGLAYFFSRRFGQIAFAHTSRGVLWKGLVGDRWAPLVAKFFFSFVSIAGGVLVIYNAVTGN